MTDRRSKTSPKNGKLARGRKTPSGIQTSSQNSLKHGVYSSQPPLVGSDDFEAYQTIKSSLVEQYDVTLPTEWIFVESATMAALRLSRLYRAQSAIVHRQVLEAEKNEISPSTSAVISRLYDDCFDFASSVTDDVAERIEEIEQQLRGLAKEESQIIRDDNQQLRLMREERFLLNTFERSLERLEESRQRRIG